MVDALSDPVVAGFLAASVRFTVPILLAALGGMLSERSGVLNVGLEGMMLLGCFVGFVTAFGSGVLWLGVLAAGAAGGLAGLAFALFAVTLRSNQVVAGIALNLGLAGLTAYLFRLAFQAGGAAPRIESFAPVPLGPLADWPVLGPLLFRHDPLTYLALGLVVTLWILVHRSAFGLSLRAVGENPEAAESVGLDVVQIRYLALLVSGGLAGLGGAFLSISATGLFLDNMTAGRGYIALAILILGRRHPFGVLAASLLFGAAEALQLRVQLLPVDVPLQALIVLPYLLTILVLAGFAQRGGAPAALGQPWPPAGR